MRTVDELIAQIPTDVAARPLWRYEAELLVNELSRLRAELAAEKERAANALWAASNVDMSKYPCPKGIHTEFYLGWCSGQIAMRDAIRAINAAPKDGEI